MSGESLCKHFVQIGLNVRVLGVFTLKINNGTLGNTCSSFSHKFTVWLELYYIGVNKNKHCDTTSDTTKKCLPLCAVVSVR